MKEMDQPQQSATVMMLDQAEKELKEMNAEVSRVIDKQTVLENRRDELRVRLLREKKMLTESKWLIRVSDDGEDVSLEAERSADEWPELSKLFEFDYHGSITLDSNTRLHRSDDEIYMSFNDPSKVASFVAEYGLQMDMSNHISTITQLEKRIHDLKKVMEKAGKPQDDKA